VHLIGLDPGLHATIIAAWSAARFPADAPQVGIGETVRELQAVSQGPVKAGMREDDDPASARAGVESSMPST